MHKKTEIFILMNLLSHLYKRKVIPKFSNVPERALNRKQITKRQRTTNTNIAVIKIPY